VLSVCVCSASATDASSLKSAFVCSNGGLIKDALPARARTGPWDNQNAQRRVQLTAIYDETGTELVRAQNVAFSDI
jgi:hypothetical protein